MKHFLEPGHPGITKQGFSLLEVIIAMALFVLIVFSIGTLIPYSQMRVQSTSRKDVAFTLAESILEKTKSLPWDSLDYTMDFDGTASSPPDPRGKGTLTQYPPSPYPSKTVQTLYPDPVTRQILTREVVYLFHVTTEYDKDSGGNLIDNLATVTIKVQWEETNGGATRQREVELRTKVCRRT
jgi:prepilin-type N-terminal cleavage/methylation domain-containing protein